VADIAGMSPSIIVCCIMVAVFALLVLPVTERE
jgi:hypothetical protein